MKNLKFNTLLICILVSVSAYADQTMAHYANWSNANNQPVIIGGRNHIDFVSTDYKWTSTSPMMGAMATSNPEPNEPTMTNSGRRRVSGGGGIDNPGTKPDQPIGDTMVLFLFGVMYAVIAFSRSVKNKNNN